MITLFAILLSNQAADTTRVRAVYDAVAALRATYEKEHGHFAMVNGIRMHYLEWGDPKGVPLVWAPGSASTGYELRLVAPRLAKAGYRVLAIDYRGHGQTRVTDYNFSIHHIADDLVALLDQLKLPKAVFGGASKGGFIAAAVYDHYPDRVSGLLMADGGTWSNQWVFDHYGNDEYFKQVARNEGPPNITGASEFEAFARLVGRGIPATGEVPPESMIETLVRISPTENGQWGFIPGFDRMMGSIQTYIGGATRPSTMPLLQWSQHAMIPTVVFRNLKVPMMILDPQEPNDELPVTDQNETLAKQHPTLIVHRVYDQTPHAVVRARPDWFVRDATELLALVLKRKP
ncbi:MAG TPA: alpha/beta hydrolase [Gemmatimonadales bacterium]|nr:alpha/beta hydrolase [Gemmatimonadales bacterium]